jgi:hypothetical protein
VKLAQAEKHVKGSHGLQESNSFSIRTSAHAFKMLSSGLYSDKVGAVLREIGCNAADAHVEVGTPDLPFEVKLPNRMDTQFYIRDFGPGLSKDDVMKMYTTYFESTKQNSNAFTGAFGLGSKSPFSYVDAFTVVSAHGGKKRTFSLHIGNEGAPIVALLTEEDADADWPHGMSIGFPVKPAEYAEFARKAQEIYQWFRVTPKVLGGQAVTPAKRRVDKATYFLADEGLGHAVLMGNVLYPLVESQMTGAKDKSDAAFRVPGVVLKMSIGSVQVVGSREQLDYNQATVKALRAALAVVVADVGADIDEAVKRIKAAAWADKQKAMTTFDQWKLPNHVLYDFMKKAGYSDDAYALLTSNYVSFPKNMGDQALVRVIFKPTHGRGSGRVVHRTVRGGVIPSGKNNTTPALLGLTDKVQITAGREKFALPRARAHVEDGKADTLVLVAPAIGDQDDKGWKAELKLLQKHFGQLPEEVLADMPVPAIVKHQRKSVKTKVAAPLPSHTVKAFVPFKPAQLAGRAHYGQQVDLQPVDLAALKEQHFMVPVTRWGNVNAIRPGAGNLGAEPQIDRYNAERGLKSFFDLQDELGIVLVSSVPIVPALEAKSLALHKRGWRSSIDVMVEKLNDATTRKVMAKAAGSWRPSEDLSTLDGRESNWAEALLYARHKMTEAEFWKAFAAVGSDLLDDVLAVYDASLKAGSKAGQKQGPRVLELWNDVTYVLGLSGKVAPLKVTKGFASMAELHQAIADRRKVPFEGDLVGPLVDKGNPGKLAGLIELIFS